MQVALDPSAPTVGASLDRTEAEVGDRLELTVSAVATGGIAASVTMAQADAPKVGPFDVLDTRHADKDLGNGRVARRFVLEIAAFETGDLEVPAIPIDYLVDGKKHTASTAPIPVHVRSLLGDEPQPKLQPLHATRSVLVEDQRLWLALKRGGIALAALAVVLIAARILRRYGRRVVVAAREAAAPPPVPPDELALQRLAAVRARGNFSVDEYRPLHFEVAEILRAYVGARYGFDSLELTTTELRAALARHAHDAVSEARIGDFLERCDLVKFAKFPSDDAAAGAVLDEAEALVRALAASARAAAEAPREVAVG